ncbi:MAG TPA: hypothetical protein VI168_04085 [Croceibacterium sp.]
MTGIAAGPEAWMLLGRIVLGLLALPLGLLWLTYGSDKASCVLIPAFVMLAIVQVFVPPAAIIYLVALAAMMIDLWRNRNVRVKP